MREVRNRRLHVQKNERRPTSAHRSQHKGKQFKVKDIIYSAPMFHEASLPLVHVARQRFRKTWLAIDTINLYDVFIKEIGREAESSITPPTKPSMGKKHVRATRSGSERASPSQTRRR